MARRMGEIDVRYDHFQSARLADAEKELEYVNTNWEKCDDEYEKWNGQRMTADQKARYKEELESEIKFHKEQLGE